MKTIEEEAEQHWDMTYMMAKDESIKPYVVNDFIAGANSKWVQAQKIKAQIEILESHIEHPRKTGYKRHDIIDTIKKLNKQLKELEDEC